MKTEIWVSVGTIVAALALFIVPGLLYSWYALEYLIRDGGGARGAASR
jgi:hypothetical protein